ncbi:50S ribosomal protein L32 [Candidatus Babeliales bacterium]|nr:50S ribosomal protein L32 [Candidatus Babeliales bacterium]
MPVPKRKVSKSRRDKRSANKGLVFSTLSNCQTCGNPVLPHQVCKECGHYKGVKVIRTKSERMYERNQTRQTKVEQGAGAQKDVPASSKE